MCGICGSFGTGDRETVGAMVRALAHRGPDDEHIVGNERFALGARRLSIMDPERGRQPLSNESGTVWAAHNGELYNFRELVAELRADGHQVVSDCDTEVLPHLYEAHGTAMAERTDGMFAYAVWDDQRQVGLLARDRMGKKPLYYLVVGTTLYFASEIKSLLRVPGFERRLNLEALHHFLSFKHVPHPLSIFEGIRALPPAHVLIHRPGQPPCVRRYWSLDCSPAEGLAEEGDLVDELLRRLRRGVKRRLVADVPVGCFLSGGIDSSLTTALAAEESRRRLKTFTLTYADGATTPAKNEDQRWARWVAERYDTEHYEEQIDAEAFPDTLPRILECFDEPFSGVVSTYFLSKVIGRHVKVAIAGDGADEIFGSYLSHRLAGPLARYDEYRRTRNPSLVEPFENQTGVLDSLASADACEWREKLLVFSEAEKAQLYSADTASAAKGFSSGDRLRRDFAGLTSTGPLSQMLEAELRSIFPDQVLAFVDRLSMAHGLEVRSAYLDTDVVRFVAKLPDCLKIRGRDTKYLLKQGARRYFPDDMVFRPKEGFVMPVERWLLTGLAPYVRDTLSSAQLGLHGLFSPEAVSRLLDEFYAGHHEHGKKILSLITFQEWYRLYQPCLPA